MRRTVPALLSGLLMIACGSRTGLAFELSDGGPSDGGPDAGADAGRRDAGFFATFPCRWSLGLPIDIGTAPAFERLTGAVHPSLDEAALLATDSSTGMRVGAIVGTSATPTLNRDLSRDGLESGALFTGVSGYVSMVEGHCIASGRDRAFEITETAMWGWMPPLSVCDVTQARPGQLVSLSRGPAAEAASVIEVEGLGGGVFTERSVGTGPSMSNEVSVFYEEREDMTLIAHRIGSSAWVERQRADTSDVYGYPCCTDSISAAPDRLRGGMLVLHHEDMGRGWSLDWLPSDRDPPQRLISLESLPAAPAGPLASNETEALIPLRNGQMVYVPLALSEVRLLGPVEGGHVMAMRVILRPGTSGGGLLFTQRSPRGDRLRFQSLICNR